MTGTKEVWDPVNRIVVKVPKEGKDMSKLEKFSNIIPKFKLPTYLLDVDVLGKISDPEAQKSYMTKFSFNNFWNSTIMAFIYYHMIKLVGEAVN